MTSEPAPFDVRPVRDDELPVLIDVFNRVYSKNKDVRTFEWKYLENPHGRSVVWVATDPEDRIVGSLAFVPRRMRIDGREALTLLASDGMVFDEWQRKGIFVRLLGIMFEKSWALGAPLVVAFTGRQSAPGLLRTGWSRVSQIQDLELPLRGAFLFRRVLHRLPFLAGPLGALGDATLRRGRLKPLLSRRLASQVRPVERFDGELAAAGQRALEDIGVHMERDTDWLNWRYVQNPSGRHLCFGAQREGRAEGYLVLETEGPTAFVAELLALDPQVRTDLLSVAVSTALEHGCQSIQCMALEGDALHRFLEAQGFRCLPEPRLLPYMLKMAPEHGESEERILDSTRWYLSHGDRDAEHMSR